MMYSCTIFCQCYLSCISEVQGGLPTQLFWKIRILMLVRTWCQSALLASQEDVDWQMHFLVIPCVVLCFQRVAGVVDSDFV